MTTLTDLLQGVLKNEIYALWEASVFQLNSIYCTLMRSLEMYYTSLETTQTTEYCGTRVLYHSALLFLGYP